MRKSSGFSPTGDSGGEQGFWPSYADMMSAIALILFFVMLLTYIQNIVTSQNLKGTEKDLAEAQAQLELTRQQISAREAELAQASADLDFALQYLDEQQLKIDEQTADIAAQQLQISQQQDSIASQQQQILDQQAQITAQQQQVTQQAASLRATQDELAAVRQQMENVAGTRTSVITQIKSSIEASMGHAGAVTIGDNGSLVLGESVLFASGQSALSGESYEVLSKLADGLYQFLSDSDNLQYVDTIVVGGHCDSTGSAEVNDRLSQQRADAVLQQLLNARGGLLRQYRQYFSATGFSSSRPIADNATPEGRAANRRIEISIALKDSTVMDLLKQYLQISSPDRQG